MFTRVDLIPLFTFVLLPGTFLLTYIIAVLLRHVNPEFPYISDTGTKSPESCIFGQLLNIGAVMVGITLYIRYKLVYEFYKNDVLQGRFILKWNEISFWLGLGSALGLSIVANFQETNILVIHYTGAMMCFGLGTIYIWIQSNLSFYTTYVNTRQIANFRTMMGFICGVAYFTELITGPISMHQFHGKDRTKWTPADGGYHLHLVSTISEWIMAIAFNLFILSFALEFQNIHLTPPQTYIRVDEVDVRLPGDYLTFIEERNPLLPGVSTCGAPIAQVRPEDA